MIDDGTQTIATKHSIENTEGLEVREGSETRVTSASANDYLEKTLTERRTFVSSEYTGRKNDSAGSTTPYFSARSDAYTDSEMDCTTNKKRKAASDSSPNNVSHNKPRRKQRVRDVRRAELVPFESIDLTSDLTSNYE